MGGELQGPGQMVYIWEGTDLMEKIPECSGNGANNASSTIITDLVSLS